MPQTITLDGKAYVILPVQEYQALISRSGGNEVSGFAEDTKSAFVHDLPVEASIDEDADDEAFALAAWTTHQAEVAEGRDLTLPRAQWDRIHSGESPLTVVREYRGLTQTQLSGRSGVARPEISAIEKGTRRGTIDTWKAMAKALAAPLDVLVRE